MSFHHHLIAGERVSSVSTRRNINPSDTSDVIGEFSEADAAQVDLAVRAAQLALPQWSRSTPQQRFDVLDFIGSEILARKQELGTLLAREEGKVLPEAIGEVTRAGYVFKLLARLCARLRRQKI